MQLTRKMFLRHENMYSISSHNFFSDSLTGILMTKNNINPDFMFYM